MRVFSTSYARVCAAALAAAAAAGCVPTVYNARPEVKGTVRDTAGAPIPGATVRVTDAEAPGGKGAGSARSDADGRFRVPPARKFGVYWLTQDDGEWAVERAGRGARAHARVGRPGAPRADAPPAVRRREVPAAAAVTGAIAVNGRGFASGTKTEGHEANARRGSPRRGLAQRGGALGRDLLTHHECPVSSPVVSACRGG